MIRLLHHNDLINLGVKSNKFNTPKLIEELLNEINEKTSYRFISFVNIQQIMYFVVEDKQSTEQPVTTSSNTPNKVENNTVKSATSWRTASRGFL